MEIIGTQVIPAPRQQVWDALNDPAILKQCLPGCESVERRGSDEFAVVVATSIGPLRARFTGTLRMTEADPPKSCVMIFEGQGGPVGFGSGSTSVVLDEIDAGTELKYSAKAQVGGKLAQVGSRLIDSVAKKMSDDFFKAFRKQLSAPAAEVGVPEVANAPGGAGAAAVGIGVTPSAGANAFASREAAPSSAASAGSHAPLPASAEPRPATAVGGTVMVPGWWLGVAMVLGVLATLAGAHWRF